MEKGAVASAQEMAKRSEAALQRMVQKYQSVDLEEYKRVKEEVARLKVGEAYVLATRDRNRGAS